MMDYCKTCVYYPPSSCDGKPCTQCDITNPFLSCYREKEFILDFQQEHKQTNADRIRAMTDEELARYLYAIGDESWDEHGKEYSDREIRLWLEWLKQEAEGTSVHVKAASTSPSITATKTLLGNKLSAITGA